ncbi:DUF7281 domain-containing protein [Shewanella gaetbuli]
MASLTKAQIKLIQPVVKDKISRVKFSANWQKIYHTFEIGEPDGAAKYLFFNGQDWQLLREMVQVNEGIDLLNVNFNQTRAEFALANKKEKYANIRPDANYVLVKLPRPVLPQEDIPYGLRMTVEQCLQLCQQHMPHNIVVVENLDAFDEIHQFNYANFPSEFTAHTLFVYRGGGGHSPAGCKRLLLEISTNAQLSKTVQVGAFADLDPAGLQIAHLLQGCQFVILPKFIHDKDGEQMSHDPLSLINDHHDYDKQWRQQKYLNKAKLQNWQLVANFMQQHRISIKQQHMLAHQLPLIYLPID